jgi:hypothetical protein
MTICQIISKELNIILIFLLTIFADLERRQDYEMLSDLENVPPQQIKYPSLSLDLH